MQPEASNADQIQKYRPACTRCGAPTMLSRIEPSGEPGYDYRTFECPACSNIDSAVLKF